jgi:hypothetical protein
MTPSFGYAEQKPGTWRETMMRKQGSGKFDPNQTISTYQMPLE